MAGEDGEELVTRNSGGLQEPGVAPGRHGNRTPVLQPQGLVSATNLTKPGFFPRDST